MLPVKDLKTRIKSVRDEFKICTQNKENLEVENRKLENENKRLQDENKRLQDDNKKFQDDNLSCNKQLNDKKENEEKCNKEVKKLKSEQKEHYERTNKIQEELKNKNQKDVRKFLNFITNYNIQLTDIVKKYEKTGNIEIPEKRIEQEIVIEKRDLELKKEAEKPQVLPQIEKITMDNFVGMWNIEIHNIKENKTENLGTLNINNKGKVNFNFIKDKDEIFKSIIDLDEKSKYNEIRKNRDDKFRFEFDVKDEKRDDYSSIKYDIYYYVIKNYEYINILDDNNKILCVLSRRKTVQNITKENGKLIYTDGRIKQTFNIVVADSDGNCFYKALYNQLQKIDIDENEDENLDLLANLSFIDNYKNLREFALDENNIKQLERDLNYSLETFEKEHNEGGENVKFKNLKSYLDYHSKDGSWVDNGIILVLAISLKLVINIYNSDKKVRLIINGEKGKIPVYLEYTGNHYNSLHLISQEKYEKLAEDELEIPEEFIKKWQVYYYQSTYLSYLKLTQENLIYSTYFIEIKQDQTIKTDMILPKITVQKDKFIVENQKGAFDEYPIKYTKKGDEEKIYVYEPKKSFYDIQKVIFVLRYKPSENQFRIQEKDYIYLKTWNLYQENIKDKKDVFTGIQFNIEMNGNIKVLGDSIIKGIGTKLNNMLNISNPRFNGSYLVIQDYKNPFLIKCFKSQYELKDNTQFVNLFDNNELIYSLRFIMEGGKNIDEMDPVFGKNRYWKIYTKRKLDSYIYEEDKKIKQETFVYDGNMKINTNGTFRIFSDKLTIKANSGKFMNIGKEHYLVLYFDNDERLMLPLKITKLQDKDQIDIYDSKENLFLRLWSTNSENIIYKETLLDLIEFLKKEIEEETSYKNSLNFYRVLSKRNVEYRIENLKDDLIFLNSIIDKDVLSQKEKTDLLKILDNEIQVNRSYFNDAIKLKFFSSFNNDPVELIKYKDSELYVIKDKILEVIS